MPSPISNGRSSSAILARSIAEARLQLALPPGGVVSRATLWVNGEEREAAYGGRGEVRAAYQRVAVQQRRDPLLVTTKGADRVLAQAFPVPRNGGTIKFKIGITRAAGDDRMPSKATAGAAGASSIATSRSRRT